jgi:hypothetical protein
MRLASPMPGGPVMGPPPVRSPLAAPIPMPATDGEAVMVPLPSGRPFGAPRSLANLGLGTAQAQDPGEVRLVDGLDR